MSSTYVHYSTTPSSLPSDYALLSRYAAANNLNHSANINEQSGSAEDADTQNGDDALAYDIDDPDMTSEERALLRRKTRRSSFPTSYITPFNPTSMGPLPDATGHRSGPGAPKATENTPLLAPLVPRIAEEVDGQDLTPSSSPRPNVLWEEIRVLTKYTLPVFATHVLEYSLVIASVVSIGHLSTTALAASTLGSMTASVSGYSIIQGFGSTLDTMLPSAWTSSQPNLVGLWSQRMAVVMAACLVPITAIWLNSEAILLALKQDPEVALLAATYLKWAVFGLPAYTFNTISRRYFQSQGLFTVPTRVIMCIAPVNAALNYLLVWGPEPFRLGFIGAPIATAISFNLISICSIIYGVWFVPKTAWHPLSLRCFTSLGVLVQLGLAGVGQTASEWWSWELVGLAASLLGPVPLATQSVLLVSASTTFQAPFALSVATSVRMGNLLGEENSLRVSYTGTAAMLMALVIAMIWSAMFMIFRTSWAHLFNDDEAVVTMVASILPVVSLFQVFDGLSAVTAGILRAQGKQFTGALLNLSAYYVIGIPFGIWLAFSRDFGLVGLWIGLTLSLVYAAGAGVWICLRTDWEYQVQKVRARIAADQKANMRYDAEHQ
ncbi:MATE efflux family protein [Trametopsis cervina]|nr:MATE efflux family protein [Trametopsis cervina]